MSNEAIEKIREIEAQSVTALANAEKEAANIRESASRGAEKVIRDARQSAAELEKQSALEAKEEADGIIAKGCEDAKSEVKIMLSDADERIGIAADKIIEETLKKWQ